MSEDTPKSTFKSSNDSIKPTVKSPEGSVASSPMVKNIVEPGLNSTATTAGTFETFTRASLEDSINSSNNPMVKNIVAPGLSGTAGTIATDAFKKAPLEGSINSSNNPMIKNIVAPSNQKIPLDISDPVLSDRSRLRKFSPDHDAADNQTSTFAKILPLVLGGTSNHTQSFTFKADSLDADALKVVKFSIEEGLSSPFTIKLSLASTNDALTENDVVDQNGLLSLYRNNQLERYFHGIVYAFTKGDTGRHHTFYEITMVPAFSRLSLRTNARIFQNKTVMEITEELLGEMGITDYALAIRNKHEPREYCVQYAESDLAFIERLLAEEGVFYYFEHEKTKHTLVFADDNSVTDELPFPCLYNNTEGGLAESSCIRGLSSKSMVAPSDAVLKDYSFKQPSFGFLNNASGNNMDYQRQNYEHYMYPGRFKDDGVGRAFSKTRIDYLRRDAKTIKGQGDIAQMISGYVMKITDHPSIALDKKWLVTHVQHDGTQPQSLDNEGGEGATTYHNAFYALPYEQQWKPEPEPKPRIYGPQIATVVGPSNEEIYTDEFGRVKVQFPWDRDGKSDEKSSCWIRVAQVGAGAGFGNIVIPRIGHEVIVSFVEGDPDQPLVTGATFNATKRASISLPADKTKMAFRGKTHDGSGTGEGYNELSFENDHNRQMFHMHAQKDMDTKVLNDRTTHVINNHTENVDQDQTMTIGKNQTLVVNQNQKETIKIDASKTVLGGRSTGVGVESPKTVGGTSNLTTAKNIEFYAGEKIILQTGASSIVLNKDGTITIHGKLVDVKGSDQIQLNCDGE